MLPTITALEPQPETKLHPPTLDDQATQPSREMLLAAEAERQAELLAEVERLKTENGSLRDLLKTEQRLKGELEVLKNAIVRNVSHELKTPLLQVKSAVALLAEEQLSDEKKQYLIELATSATTRLEVLVKNITMLGESLDINPGPLIIADAIEAARRNMRRIWEHRDQTARIIVELPPTLPPVLADKQGLSTVFQLLIDNALKFSKERVVIHCEVVPQGDYVEISVRDTGIGIAKDKQGRIFDIFYQVDSSSTRRYGGAGVGLALVRLILEHHGAQIQVESELDKGSTFSFKLPVVKL